MQIDLTAEIHTDKRELPQLHIKWVLKCKYDVNITYLQYKNGNWYLDRFTEQWAKPVLTNAEVTQLLLAPSLRIISQNDQTVLDYEFNTDYMADHEMHAILTEIAQ